MSKNEQQIIRHLTLRNKELEDEVLELRREIKDLEEKLYKDKFYKKGGAAGVAAAIEEIVEEAAKDRREYEAIIANLQEMVPPLPDIQYLKIEGSEEDVRDLEAVISLNRTEHWKGSSQLPANAHCGIGYSIRIIFGDTWEMEATTKDFMIFPGTVEEATAELNYRILPLIARSPSIDDIPGYLPDVPIEKILISLIPLAVYRYIEPLRPQYQKMFTTVFKRSIEPHLAANTDLNMARNTYLKLVDKSFKNMETRHRGISLSKTFLNMPKGRPRKI